MQNLTVLGELNSGENIEPGGIGVESRFNCLKLQATGLSHLTFLIDFTSVAPVRLLVTEVGTQ